MIPYQNNEIYTSVIFFFLCKIVCVVCKVYRVSMYDKRQSTLTSIPERNENEEEALTAKWVPLKKHEALKGKYKMLKRLFQVYDASVSYGYLSGPCGDGYFTDKEKSISKRKREEKKRSIVYKSDAFVCTDTSFGDITDRTEETRRVNSARDTRKSHHSLSSVPPADSNVDVKPSKYVATQVSNTDTYVVNEMNSGLAQIHNPPPAFQIPYLALRESRGPSRFQCLLQRILGLRLEKHPISTPNVYSTSDSNVYGEKKRRRRGLRFRRLQRTKKSLSKSFCDMNSPAILSCVQLAQTHCLLDNTPRQCPILNCNTMLFGIINYNDHLNLCHFKDRKFICHYCHAGFEQQSDKIAHENEHIGINKMHSNATSLPTTGRQSINVSDTPTVSARARSDIPEDKLKKIVSFFDKIDSEQLISEINKRHSETNFHSTSKTKQSDGMDNSICESVTSKKVDKRTVSCVNITNERSQDHSKSTLPATTERTLKCAGNSIVKCPYCEDDFQTRRQLSLHVDLEHCIHNQYSKYPRSESSSDSRDQTRCDVQSENGQISVRSIDTASPTQRSFSDTSQKSGDLSCDASNNIDYCSREPSKKYSVINNLMKRVKSINYKWEPTVRRIG